MEYSLRMTTLVVLWNRKSCVWNYYQDTWHVTTTLCLRKRLWHPGHVHHIGSSLFGQPFLLVTLRNSTEDKIYNLLPLRVCWYVRIPVGAQGTEGSLHHSKDQIINGHDPVGIHEEGLSVNTEICELNDDSSHERSRTSPRHWRQSVWRLRFWKWMLYYGNLQGQLLTGSRSDSLHLITWAVLMPAASEMIPGSFNLVRDSWG